MPALPTEVLQYICEHSGEVIASWPSQSSTASTATHNPTTQHFLSLLAFSSASRDFRQASIPYIFRRMQVRTTEEALAIVQSSLLKHAKYLNFPATDALTSRRPLNPTLRVLVAQAKSIRIAATSPTFFLTAQATLSRLLVYATMVDTLELYCEHIKENVNTALLLADLVPALPNSLVCLRITLPGGQPDYRGVETFLKALSSSHPGMHQALPGLKVICLSMHLSPFYCQKPEKLAIDIARRVPSLEHMTVVAPGRNQLYEANLADPTDPLDDADIWGGFRQEVMSWEFLRGLEQANNITHNKANTGHEVVSQGGHWIDAQLYD
ncbi:hypothetical protein BDV93DRAFT_526340 [Ceratobasidium sp. AG-I]|nr:hypothetical protein BDV93DRAFT_526340 [Ceratobasidium sp. AG-I]